MNRTLAGLGRNPVPAIQDPLSKRLKTMADDFRRVSFDGCGLTQDDVEQIGRELQACVRTARDLEGSKKAAVNEHVASAFELLHQAEEAIAAARSALRERLEDAEVDPTGSIRAALGHGVTLVAKVEQLIGGRLPV